MIFVNLRLYTMKWISLHTSYTISWIMGVANLNTTFSNNSAFSPKLNVKDCASIWFRKIKLTRTSLLRLIICYIKHKPEFNTFHNWRKLRTVGRDDLIFNCTFVENIDKVIRIFYSLNFMHGSSDHFNPNLLKPINNHGYTKSSR